MDVAPLSQFCVGELARQRRGRSLPKPCVTETGALSVETCALAALRALESEARHQRSRKLTLKVSEPVQAWLEADTIGWREAMTDRIGPRFVIEGQADKARDWHQVSS